MQLQKVVPTANELGEGVRWDVESQSFWWTDILGKVLYNLPFDADVPERIETPKRLASFALTSDPSRLLCAFDDEIAVWTPGTGALETRYRLDVPGQRFNDGRTDPDGYFWVGTMVEDTRSADAPAALYRLVENRNPELIHGQLSITNSICWSPDGKQRYFSDSAKQEVYRVSGPHGQKELFVRLENGEPDGATTDRAGHFWLACWGIGELREYDPTGMLVASYAIPATQVSCCAFGGPEFRHLAITSARADLVNPRQNDGSVFIYLTSSQGYADMPAQLA